MLAKSEKFFKLALEYSFYLFVFLLPWQTKLILRSADTNFNEISLYLSHLLLLLILIGFFSYELKRRSATEPISLVWLALVGLELGVLISFFFAPDQVLAFYHYILILVGIALFYLLRAGTFVTGYDEPLFDRLKIIYSFLASIFLQALLGIYQFLSQTTFSNKYLGLASHDPGLLGTAVIETTSGRWLRAYGGLDHPNILGGILSLGLIMAAYLLASKKKIRSAREIMTSAFLFVFYFVALFALFFTFSRSAWLAFAAGLAVLLFILVYEKDRWVWGRYLVLIFFSVVMVVLVGYPYRDLLRVRVSDDTRLEQKSLTERQTFIGQAAQLIKRDGWLGVGIGNYPLVLELQDSHQQSVWNYQPVHDVFLLLWAESGIFSLLFFLVFLICLLKKDRRSGYGGALLTALVILMLFDHWLFSLPFGVLILFLFLGLI